jgi:integrase
MRKPWKKPDRWPHEALDGEKSWHLGYRDADGTQRAKSFPSAAAANRWLKSYVEADVHNRLREFLLGSDAPEMQPDSTPVGELLLDWLATDAHPDSPGGLARSTWESYRSLSSRHIIGNPTRILMKKTGEIIEVRPAIEPLGRRGGYAIGQLPVTDFETADTLKRWVQAMRMAGVTSTTEARVWKILSSALSWAVESNTWPVSINGCLTMQRRRGMRRASRRAGTGASRRSEAPGKRRDDLSSWALSPLAVERIRLVMLERVDQRPRLAALRDATVVSVQYGLAMRNQEVWALSIGDVSSRRAMVREVLSYNELDTGKTAGATGPSRRPPIDRVLLDDIAAWTAALGASGYPVTAWDFLFRGDFGGHGTPHGHMSGNQAKKWPVKYFTPAVIRVAELWPEEHGDIVGATPYSLRRGMISLRIRAGEDRQAIAKQCGTSVEMLERSYSFAIEDLEDEGTKPAEQERLRAREIATSNGLPADKAA